MVDTAQRQESRGLRPARAQISHLFRGAQTRAAGVSAEHGKGAELLCCHTVSRTGSATLYCPPWAEHCDLTTFASDLRIWINDSVSLRDSLHRSAPLRGDMFSPQNQARLNGLCRFATLRGSSRSARPLFSAFKHPIHLQTWLHTPDTYHFHSATWPYGIRVVAARYATLDPVGPSSTA